ncbi:Glycosyl transferase, group 2 family [Psychrobacter nivimaris]|uniref:Glycosyl transferase, group 2 family n=1 Tax=Psychrobacter nivimaris TaxID=281738 RepID=A0A6N7C3G0_9GAMM|nr:glycosyltransferase family 2 protein [Psychrobacter nivimaris]KAF0569357.1 Glycosyl transferase, group 2 family [Psychrobacter nivimaris]|tara:strand:- start:4356 stop:6536 length:2181 start_codon:yes stop_codon:yes gene_type:complete
MKILSWLNYKITPQVRAAASFNFVDTELTTRQPTIYQLLFSSFEKSLLYGFYFFELDAKCECSLGYYKIHIQLKSDKSVYYSLPVVRKGKHKRLIWLPESIQEIFLSSDKPSKTIDISITINKVSQNFARKKIQQKIIKKSEYSNDELKELSFEECWELYDTFFPTHKNQSNYIQWIRFKEPKLWFPVISDTLEFQIILMARTPSQLRNCKQLINQLMHFETKNKVLLLSTIACDKKSILNEHTSETLDVITVSVDKIVYRLNIFLSVNKPSHCLFIDSTQACTLSPYIFSELTHYIKQQSNCEIIYFDEDRLYKEQRVHPIFKQNLNIDLLYSQNYIGNSCYISYSSFVKQCGFDPVLQDSFLYHHYLKTSQQSPHNIAHISKILLHRVLRDKTDSTASTYSLSYEGPIELQHFSSLQCITQFFKTVNPSVTINAGMLPNTHHIIWPLPHNLPKVAIIIPTKDRIDLVKTAVDSIFTNTTYTNYEIIIVNNNSEKASSLEYFERLVSQHTNVTCLDYPYPFNYSAINNFAAKHTSAPVLVFLNNDVKVISANWLTELVRQALREDIGCVGAKLYYENGLIQHAGVIMGLGHVAGHSHRFFDQDSDGYLGRLKQVQNYLAVTGACLAIRRSVFEEIDGFEEEKLPVAYNDVDLCLKSFKKGYRNVWTPYAELYHYESLSRGKDTTPEKKARFLKEVGYMHHKWDTYIKSDPYHNPNFAANKENFTV